MFQIDVSDVYSVQTEVNLAKLFALAANSDPLLEVPIIEVRLLRSVGGKEPGEGSQAWSRQDRDVMLLCLDRAVARVYPPLDPLQYTEPPPELGERDGERMVRIHVIPTARLFSFYSVPHRVEGVVEAPSSLQSHAIRNVDDEGVNSIGAFESPALCRRRWRSAAWLTARFFNESSWASSRRCNEERGADNPGTVHDSIFSDVVDAAESDGQRRWLHVDVAGMEFVGLITAVTSRYAYVAVPHQNEGQTSLSWVLVTRLGIPAALEHAVERGFLKRQRGGSGGQLPKTFLYEREVVSHDATPFRMLRAEDCIVVTLRAHKVYCRQQPPEVGSPGVVSVSFEDTAFMEEVRGAPAFDSVQSVDVYASFCNTFVDVVEVVRRSCKRFLRGYHKYKRGGSDSSTERLFAALTDTVSARTPSFGGGGRRRRSRPPITVSSPRDISLLFEGTCVEFKAKASKWTEKFAGKELGEGTFCYEPSLNNVERSGAEGGTGYMNTERIRHTIAAMASTLGGVLIVGVRDDGTMLGHSPEALKGLRLTGFCPAMSKGSVQCTTMRAVCGTSPVALPKEWWKSTGQHRAQRADEEKANLVVTVVTVSRGLAPFYTVARQSVPYMRGFASTLPLHVISIARRITVLLP